MPLDHSAMPHGGFVILGGNSSLGLHHPIGCLPQQPGPAGCKTVFDVAPGLLSPRNAQLLRAELL
ncbi:MAG: hypothetical protein LBV56_01155 [Delftia acidovorans]|nr:hypothetical protein [Delftia acidovorans]